MHSGNFSYEVILFGNVFVQKTYVPVASFLLLSPLYASLWLENNPSPALIYKWKVEHGTASQAHQKESKRLDSITFANRINAASVQVRQL